MRCIKWSLKGLVESLNGFNPTKDTPCRFKCPPITGSIFAHQTIHGSFISIELQRSVLIKRWVRVPLNNSPNRILKIFHPFGVASNAGQSIADSRIACSRIRNDFYWCGIETIAARIHQQIRLQAVGKIENNFATVVRERQRMCKNVLCPFTSRKIVTLPIRTVSRIMTFHNPVVIRYSRFAETRTPDALPRCVLKIFNDIDFQSSF